METMNVGSILLGFCLNVEGPAVRIDDRGARNPYFWSEIRAALIGKGHSRDTGGRINETRLPERGAGRIGVKGIDTVVFGCQKDYVVELSSNLQPCNVQGLGIDLAIHGK